MLPVIAEANRNLEAAMDAVGFGENERRSLSSKFTVLKNGAGGAAAGGGAVCAVFRSPAPVPPLPDLTAADVTDWIDRLTSTEGPSILADAGQYGLDFVAEQANDIFFVIAPILFHTKLFNPNGRGPLAQVLQHERVSWALDDLFFQINELADLA